MTHYGPPRLDLTPLDLQLAGYTICAAPGGKWMHWRRNPYAGAPDGPGAMTSYWYDTVAEVIDDARWLMTGRAGVPRGQFVLVGLE